MTINAEHGCVVNTYRATSEVRGMVRFANNEHVVVAIYHDFFGSSALVDLRPTEARQLAAALVALADQIEAGGR